MVVKNILKLLAIPGLLLLMSCDTYEIEYRVDYDVITKEDTTHLTYYGFDHTSKPKPRVIASVLQSDSDLVLNVSCGDQYNDCSYYNHVYKTRTPDEKIEIKKTEVINSYKIKSTL